LLPVSHVEGEDKQSIVVTELPYQVNKAKLITKIAELVKDKFKMTHSDMHIILLNADFWKEYDYHGGDVLITNYKL
jgi:DNA gyrase/topoisomerase IV subunit A